MITLKNDFLEVQLANKGAEIIKIIGQKDQRTQSSSVNGNTTTISYSIRKEYRVPPEAFGQLKDDLFLICDDGSYGKYKKNYYFKY